MSIVLDTSAVSLLMQRSTAALRRLSQHPPGEVILTSPVAAEVHFGLCRLPEASRRRLLLEAEYGRLRSLVRWHDWNEAAAEEFGRQKARLERSGQPLEDMDVAIGSIAIRLGATLATCNARHMARLDGLAIEDWSV